MIHDSVYRYTKHAEMCIPTGRGGGMTTSGDPDGFEGGGKPGIKNSTNAVGSAAQSL